jgi:2'-5' RNA ligase
MRTFVALWPDAMLRTAIAAQRQRWSWPAEASITHTERLHLTLHFLGHLASEQVGAVREALRGVAFAPMTLSLDVAELWNNGVAVLRPRTPPAALATLHAAIGEALVPLGFKPPRRRFLPHVTFARKAEGALPPASAVAVAWRVEGFVLVESRLEPPPARYLVIESYR